MKLERTKNAARNVVFGGIAKIYNLAIPLRTQNKQIINDDGLEIAKEIKQNYKRINQSNKLSITNKVLLKFAKVSAKLYIFVYIIIYKIIGPCNRG